MTGTGFCLRKAWQSVYSFYLFRLFSRPLTPRIDRNESAFRSYPKNNFPRDYISYWQGIVGIPRYVHSDEINCLLLHFYPLFHSLRSRSLEGGNIGRTSLAEEDRKARSRRCCKPDAVVSLSFVECIQWKLWKLSRKTNTKKKKKLRIEKD